jgi:hypothetical protein
MESILTNNPSEGGKRRQVGEGAEREQDVGPKPLDNCCMRTLLVLALVVVATGCDLSPPKVIDLSPEAGFEVRGVRVVPIDIVFSDDSDVTVRLLVDDFEIGKRQIPCGSDRCAAELLWDTKDADIGTHEIEVVLSDESGNVTHKTRTLWIDDVLKVTDIEVTGEVDESGTLELEVYAFDDRSGDLIGCSGSRQGLAPADASDVDYPITSLWINPAGYALDTRDANGKPIRFEVWEDDDDPVCPTKPELFGNNLIGTSEPLTVDEIRALDGPMQFGRVTRLGVEWLRDLDRDAGMFTPPEPDTNGDGDPGCSTTRAAGSWPLAFALGLLRMRRRARGRRAPGRR